MSDVMGGLLPDWRTDRVTLVLPTAGMHAYNEHLAELELFYADFLRELARHDEVVCLVENEAQVRKMQRLSGIESEGIFRISAIPDIWIRDFGPQAAAGGCTKFRYAPAGGSPRLNREIDAAMAEHLAREGIPVKTEDLALEGGNLVHDGRIGIATRKLFQRNRGRSEGELIEHFTRVLGLERLVVVPVEPGDRTGHVDATLRWLDGGRLVVNDYRGLEGAAGFERRLLEKLDEALPDVERVRIPYLWSTTQRRGWYDARGNYANFLMTANRVYLPVYGVEQDEQAREIFEALLPGRVSTIDARAIAGYGGSLHCITWNHAHGR